MSRCRHCSRDAQVPGPSLSQQERLLRGMEVRPRAQLAGRQPQLVLIVLLTRLVVPPSA